MIDFFLPATTTLKYRKLATLGLVTGRGNLQMLFGIAVSEKPPSHDGTLRPSGAVLCSQTLTNQFP